MDKNNINFNGSYDLDGEFQDVRERAGSILGEFIGEQEPIFFSESEKKVHFLSEQLIPEELESHPNIMFLFSNPHPHSIRQGMFLSPNTQNIENPFWRFMEESGWFLVPKERPIADERRDIFLQRKYSSDFSFIFHCYYEFPTCYPNHIKKIFGTKFFKEKIKPIAEKQFLKTLSETKTQAVLTFNKDVYNLIAFKKVKTYTQELHDGRIISSQIKGCERNIPVFLTYPTGWRFHKNIRELRRRNLSSILEKVKQLTAVEQKQSKAKKKSFHL